VGFYNTHLRKTADPTPITKSKLERGMVVKIKYKAQGKTPKLYMVLVLQPKWPNSTEGKLHGLSLDNIPPQKFLEFAKVYNEVVSKSSKVKKLDLAKIQITEASKVFYTSEIKTSKPLKSSYRTFNLLDIQSIQSVNYDWGKFDKVADRDARRKKLEEEARERADNNDVTN
jgi:hypothetical protein|tara:strand:- start:350 stop:862 length:513 start_codon:yes stop_codon:yes gene_type:complete